VKVLIMVVGIVGVLFYNTASAADNVHKLECVLSPTTGEMECSPPSSIYGYDSCPLSLETIQLFDTETCSMNMKNFDNMMTRASSFGSERTIVFAITDAESGEGKSLFLSLLAKCPSQFKSECKGGEMMGGVTKGVWTHDKPLTCCALSLVHGIADTSQCPCQCHGDSRDLDAGSNSCPLLYLLDVEGTDDVDGQCSMTPFYLLAQTHLRVIRTDRVTPIKAYRNSLTLVVKMEDVMRSHTSAAASSGSGAGSSLAGGNSQHRGNHQLHYINAASPFPSIVGSLRSCEKCKEKDIENRFV